MRVVTGGDRRRSDLLSARSHLTEGAPLDAIERQVRTTARPAWCGPTTYGSKSRRTSLRQCPITVPRVGQPVFEALVLGAYQRLRATTASRIEPVLEGPRVGLSRMAASTASTTACCAQ